MSSMVLDAVRFNSLVMPNLEQAKKKLAETAKYGTQISSYIPVSTTSGTRTAGARESMLRNQAKSLSQRLGTASNNVNTITVKLDAKVEKAKLIEKKNKAKTTAISAAVGAVAGAAGAAIGAATGGIKGAVVGGAVAAAGAVVATKVVTSVGKALKNTCAKVAKSVGNFFSSVWKGIKDIGKSIWDACKKIANKVVSFVKEKIAPILKKIMNGVWEGIKFLGRCAATVVNLAVSLVEGIVSFVEAIGDVVLIVVGGVCSIVTALADIVRGVCTGEWDWKCTGSVWKKWIMPWVGYDWTSKLFSGYSNSFIDRAAFGWAKRDTGLGYKIGKGVGYVVGVIALTAVTAGGGGAAVSAASAASSAGASAIGAAGAGAAAFVSSATAAVGTSTIIAGAAKVGAEAQKGYNKLSDEDKQNMGSIGKVLLSSTIKGGVEAATWYVTYGGGAKTLAGATDAAVKAGAKVTMSTKAATAIGKAFTGSAKTWVKAGMQAGKEFVNEGANAIVNGKYDLESAATNAIVSAGTSIFYDKTVGKWLGDADKGHKATYTEKLKAAEQAKVDQSVVDEVFDAVDDQAAAATKEASKKAAKEAFDLDYYMNSSLKEKLLNLSQEAGGKKAFGKAVKDVYKEGIKIPVNGIADAIVGAQ